MNRTIAEQSLRLAKMAVSDTINGGARALVYAKRLNRMNSNIPAMEIVSNVYSSSLGKIDRHTLALIEDLKGSE